MSVTLFRGGKEAQGFFHDMMRGGVKLAGLDIVLTPNGLNVPFMVDKVPEFFDILNELGQILNSPATGKEESTE